MDSWQEPQTLATYLLIVLVFVFILISAIIVAVRISLKKTIEAKENESKLKIEYQQKLLENSILTQERERSRIAADIHDDLIGKLTAIKMINQLNDKSSKIDALLTKGIEIARGISHDLMPPLIDYTSLEELVRETILPHENQIKIKMTINVIENTAISSKIKIHIIRIIQEIIVNIHKHSHANLITFHLRISPQWITMIINDNGIGFNLESVKHGLGMSNIETRIQYINGRYKLKSKDKKGTKFIFLIPAILEKME